MIHKERLFVLAAGETVFLGPRGRGRREGAGRWPGNLGADLAGGVLAPLTGRRRALARPVLCFSGREPERRDLGCCRARTPPLYLDSKAVDG